MKTAGVVFSLDAAAKFEEPGRVGPDLESNEQDSSSTTPRSITKQTARKNFPHRYLVMEMR